MTGEWAATNTLRVPPGHAPACQCTRCEKHAAALALVEAALVAAERVVDDCEAPGQEHEDWKAVYSDHAAALAAALRAVREGK